MRAPLHASAIDCPLPKFGVVSGNDHEVRFSLSISTVLFKLANAEESLRLPSGFTNTVQERERLVEGEARAPLILVDAQLGHAIDEPPTHLDLEPTPRLEERGQGADLKFQQREHPQPYTMTFSVGTGLAYPPSTFPHGEPPRETVQPRGVPADRREAC